jgi:hypothetical protein
LAIFFLRHFFAFDMVTSPLDKMRAAMRAALPVSLSPLLFPSASTLFALCLALGNAPLLTLGHKVPLFLGIAENPIPGHSFAKAL